LLALQVLGTLEGRRGTVFVVETTTAVVAA